MRYDLCVVGGFGHVGLPLSIAFASRGLKVCAMDISEAAFATISSGKTPFLEYGADDILRKVLDDGSLRLSMSKDDIAESDAVIIVVGTPVDLHLNPEFGDLKRILDSYVDCFRDGQLIILRSTVYPGTTQKVERLLHEKGKKVDVAFCPERIAEGYAMRELFDLPQIVSSYSASGLERVSKLFGLLAPEVIVLDPLEAELAKLFTNSWRYIKFSVANQFFMIANDCGADYHKIHAAMARNYPRCQDMPGPGFAAGPCLFKDTVQLSAFNNHSFYVGHSAILINEGLPYYIISKLKQKLALKDKTVGILGMAFKANIDDKRDSLSYKLKKLVEFECGKVLCSDVYIDDPRFIGAEQLVKEADVIILATPHREYAGLVFSEDKTVVDIWNFYGKGCSI